MTRQHTLIQHLAILVSVLVVVAPALAQKDRPNPAEAKRSQLRPLIDTPLRDTSVSRCADGTWYMTGTVPGDGADFQNNDGISLWRSTDLKKWESVGQVWSIDKHATAPQSAWQREKRVNPDNPSGPLVRGMVSPEIHCFKETCWITYSMNGQGTGLLRSSSGKAEGPYVDLGRLTTQGTDASIFVDDDGSIYWLVGQGWIAKMKPDCSGLAENPQLLRPAPLAAEKHGNLTMSSTHSPQTLGMAGAHMFKANGRYWLTAADVWGRLGVGCYDTFVASSDKITGPYTWRNMMIPHGGQVTVFQGPDKQWWSTFSGRDSRAILRDRPAALPLIFDNSVLYARAMKDPFPRKPFDLFTEFGPWDRLKMVAPYHIRDLQFSLAPDGYAYLTGSGTDADYAGRIMLFRSKNMRDWEPVKVEFDFMGIPGVDAEDYRLRFEGPKAKESLSAKYMDSEIYYLGDTFHIFTSLYGIKGGQKADGSTPFGGTMWLRSTTGKPEGPYKYVDRARSQSSAFVDDDGKTYLFYNGTLSEFDPKGDKIGEKTMTLTNTAGTRFCAGDVATNLVKIHGKYMIFATGWCGGTDGENIRIDSTYDWVYWQSDTLQGPYDMPRRAYAMPHCGHSCPPVKGADGRWYGLFFGNESTSPWLNYPGVLVFDVRLDKDDTVRIEVKDELP